MKRLLLTAAFALLAVSSAQQGAPLSGIVQSEDELAPQTRVAIHVARFNMYVDENGNSVFDRVQDKWYIGIPRLENPPGFFTLLYVDQAATLTGSGVELQLSAGWNVFTVRFPDDRAVYAVGTSVEDIVLDVILP